MSRANVVAVLLAPLLLAAAAAAQEPAPQPAPPAAPKPAPNAKDDATGDAHEKFAAACKLHESGDATGALAAFRALADAEPDNAARLLAIAQYLIHQRSDFVGGEAFARRAFEHAQDQEIAWRMLGGALLGQKKLDEARKLYVDGLARFPKSGSLAFGAATACGLAEHHLEATEWFQKAVELEPKNAQFHYGLGEILAVRRLYAEAEVELKRALRGWPDAGWKLGEVLAAQGRAADAEKVLRGAVTRNKGLTRWHAGLALGVLWFEQGRHEEAEKMLRQVVETRPKEPNGWLYLARTQKALGRDDDAAKSIQTYRELARAADRREDEALLAQIGSLTAETPATTAGDEEKGDH